MRVYLEYAVLGVNSCTWQGEIERDDSTSLYSVMVQLNRRKRETSGDRGNHDETLELERISCAGPFNIPDPVGYNNDTRSSKPNQAIYTSAICMLVSGSLQQYLRGCAKLRCINFSRVSAQQRHSSRPLE
jgi:hypothetical protein